MHTKGEVLLRAVRLGVVGWQNTTSCVRGPRDKLNSLPCGVCAGCLLRRSAMLAAQYQPIGYFWDRLAAASLDLGRSNPAGREATRNDWDIMQHGAHTMNELADLAELDADADVFLRTAWELSGGSQPAYARTTEWLHRLIQVHAKEWYALQSFFGSPNLLTLQRAS